VRNRIRKTRRRGTRLSEREHLVQALWTLFEPIHAVTYFSPEAREAFAGIGLTRYWDGYFAGRAALLGAVTAAPMVAMLSGFAPFLVERVLPAVWSTVAVDRVLDARSDGAAATLRTLVPDERSVTEAADLLAQAAARADTVGRPLAAANSALSVESDPYRRLWQAAATLREHRGDGYVVALVEGGIAGLSTIVLRSAGDIDATTIRKARGWTEEQWAAEVEELVSRGLLGDQREGHGGTRPRRAPDKPTGSRPVERIDRRRDRGYRPNAPADRGTEPSGLPISEPDRDASAVGSDPRPERIFSPRGTARELSDT